ncbi:hypothetical protein WR25_13409 [Diploscapter pachys]|uniref:Uncharacterized protein n=1 Tax=Diploscapter pachys TaxID=2018661 RepID=A0A2A2KMR3_9BILA|nr:hypothetical protein WR25_13409 [Diploscapter pachys]
MSSNPSWWPYRISFDLVVKKSGFLVAGLIVGANIVSYYWQPMKSYERDLEAGKIALLKKYKSIHEERFAANN